jgi:hypothetical protein
MIIVGREWWLKQNDARLVGRVRGVGRDDGYASARCGVALLRCVQSASSG